ncbi:UPF0696 protein C11orf68 homolog [Patiria miniata]|uniref:Uncharacterized protein n=1 Tax=Patiria miniata TaxID=46514 RepID=A0A913Z624_PATMI|nr:UPF0696 protein C11orf68 homolog [Patiria miniata]
MEESDDDEEMPALESIFVDLDLELVKLHPPTNTGQTQAADEETPGPCQPLTVEQSLDHGYTDSEPFTTPKGNRHEQVSILDKWPAKQLPEPPCVNKPHLGSQPLPSASEQLRFTHQQTGSARHHKTAKELAAEALAADEGGWLIFDPNLKQEANLKYQVEEFLARYPPSRVREVNGSPVNWICGKAPRGDSTTENGSDKVGLFRTWEDLLQSGRPTVTFQEIKRIAVAHRCLSGKWLVWKETGVHVDLTWERIFRATVAGQLGTSTKVSSALNDGGDNSRSHLTCVYSKDFTDKSGVLKLESRLRQLGIRCRLAYKPDVFSYLGVYRGNEWGLKPTIYTSEFDVRKNASVVISVYE